MGKGSRAGRGPVRRNPQDWGWGRQSMSPVSGWTGFGSQREGVPLEPEARLPGAELGPASEAALHPWVSLGASASSPVKWSVCLHPGRSLGLLA